MVLVTGGIFWMGHSDGLDEESPRHRAPVRSFCMDRTEVTVGEYRACQDSGKCTPARADKLCTIKKAELSDHPINCVDWNQAKAFCELKGRRLPTEREWEYSARGGSEQRTFAWGAEPPDGRSCYSHQGTCKVGSYPPGAFGILDQTGNVWEWTSSAFGPYPTEIFEGPQRVYRGGSFSRRFPKWMRNGLRNRSRPDEWGAHLGFRCAADLPGATCPPGSHPEGPSCTDDSAEPLPVSRLIKPGATSTSVDPSPVTTTRDAQYDPDCLKHKPGRPIAYLVKGGTFAERQRSKGACVNRDVGVGFNSICCAQ